MTKSNDSVVLTELQVNVLNRAEADNANLLFILDVIDYELTIAFPKMKGDIKFYCMDVNDEIIAHLKQSQDAMINAVCYVANETIENLDLEHVEITKICGATFEPTDEPKVNGMSTGVISMFTGDVLKASGTQH